MSLPKSKAGKKAPDAGILNEREVSHILLREVKVFENNARAEMFGKLEYLKLSKGDFNTSTYDGETLRDQLRTLAIGIRDHHLAIPGTEKSGQQGGAEAFLDRIFSAEEVD